MRVLSVLQIALALGVVLADDAAGAPSPSGSDGDDDLDLEDDFEDEDTKPPPGAQMGGAPPQVDDFDLALPESDRTNRMGVCFSYTIGRLQARRELMQRHAQEMMEHHGIKQDQAMTAVLSSWMMTCYMNVEESLVGQALGTPFGAPIETPAGKEEEMFGHNPSASQTAQQASQRQWALLQSSLNANQHNMPGANQQQQQQQQQKQQSQSPRGQPAVQPLGMGMDSSTSFIYMVAVFVVLFGVGALVVGQLHKKEEAGQKVDRGSKAEKKAEKAERAANRRK